MPALSRDQLKKAVDGALRVRKKAKIPVTHPLCVYSVADAVGVDVRFVGGNSFGGMYVRDFGRILIPSRRPPGRQAFTCAHELGHWHFDHGTRVEQIDLLDKGGDDDPEERLANVFATYLLIPKWAVEDALRRRSLSPSRASALEFYGVANQLGVGYETLLKHLHYGLGLLSSQRLTELLKDTPKAIRETILGANPPGHLILADPHWHAVAVDLAVGDAVRLPDDAAWTGPVLRHAGPCVGGQRADAVRPGIVQVVSPSTGWGVFVRVARADYTGRSKYRFLEDPDVDEPS